MLSNPSGLLFTRTGDFALSIAHERKAARFARPHHYGRHRDPVADQSPLVLAMLAVIQKQASEIQDLRDEIQRLKKTTTRPDIKPSRLLDPPPEEGQEPGKKMKRPGSKKRSKTKSLRIDVEEIIHPEELPPGAKFEGYRDFVVQDIVMKSQNTRYR